MTNPSEPGHPSRPPAPGGPYGPPPPHGPGTGPIPVPRPPSAGPQGQQWVPPQRSDKGLFGALFDANFNSMVTPKLIKLSYVLALMLIFLQCLVFLGIGLWVASWDDLWGWGVILLVGTPLVALFELLLVRIFMESLVVRFKEVEYLRVIKDKI